MDADLEFSELSRTVFVDYQPTGFRYARNYLSPTYLLGASGSVVHFRAAPRTALYTNP